MNLDSQLQDLRARCTVALPTCSVHANEVAVAFCSGCGKAVCESCVTVAPVEVRCEQCRSTGTGLLPSQTAWLAGFLRGLWRRPWAMSFVIAAVVFAALILIPTRRLSLPGGLLYNDSKR